MKLLTKKICAKLPSVRETRNLSSNELVAHAKLFHPLGPQIWYVCGYDPQSGLAFGAAKLYEDFGFGIGEFNINELAAIKIQFGPVSFAVERETRWRSQPLRELIGREIN